MEVGRGEVEGVPETGARAPGRVRVSDTSGWAERLVALVALVVITALDFGIWLSWCPGQVVYYSHEEGWRITGLAAVLVIAAAAAGWRRHFYIAICVIPYVLTICFSWYASSFDNADGLWGVGAMLMLLGSSMGVLLVAGLACLAQGWIQKRRAIHRL